MAKRAVGGPTEFRFSTSTDIKKVPSRYSGPIAYPLPEGVETAQRSRYPSTYQFKARMVIGRSLPPHEPLSSDGLLQDDFSIHGKQAGSKNEWYLYQALLLGGVSDFEIEYQVPWHGGRELGGQVLDFVVSQGGADLVLRLMGRYWHASAYGTPLDTYTKSQMEGEGYIVYDIPDYDATSREDALSTLARLRVI